MNPPDIRKVITDLTEARGLTGMAPSSLARNAEIAKLCGDSIVRMERGGVKPAASLAPMLWDRYIRWKDEQQQLDFMDDRDTLEFLHVAIETLKRIDVAKYQLKEDDLNAWRDLATWHPGPLLNDA